MADTAKTAPAATAPADTAPVEGAAEGTEGAEGGAAATPEQTDLQRRAQFNRQFAAFSRKEKEFAQRQKVEREKFEAERQAFAQEQQRLQQERQQLEQARRDPNEWLRLGGFNYDQVTEAQVRKGAAPSTTSREDPFIKKLEDRQTQLEQAFTEREKRLLERENAMTRQQDLNYIGKQREAAKEKYELLNHFADDNDEKIDDQVYDYMIKHREKYGEVPTIHEAFQAIEDAIFEREEARVKKSLAAQKIARRIGWTPQQDNQPGDDATQVEEPPEQQTKKPARGTPKKPTRAGTRPGRFADLPKDAEKRLEAMKLQLSRRAT